jgi:hypothetical protein
MLDLKKKADLQRLVDEGLEESLTLDYKASPSLARDSGKPEELCKDVSALANSAGGQLIYGIEEDKTAGKPSKVDDGVTDPKITKEWIEQILNSKVQPRMDGVRIERIDMETGKFGYVISVQQSQTGPHQAPDGKYYKRFNFQSVPMHDYEIRDIMRRSTTPIHVVLDHCDLLPLPEFIDLVDHPPTTHAGSGLVEHQRQRDIEQFPVAVRRGRRDPVTLAGQPQYLHGVFGAITGHQESSNRYCDSSLLCFE